MTLLGLYIQPAKTFAWVYESNGASRRRQSATCNRVVGCPLRTWVDDTRSSIGRWFIRRSRSPQPSPGGNACPPFGTLSCGRNIWSSALDKSWSPETSGLSVCGPRHHARTQIGRVGLLVAKRQPKLRQTRWLRYQSLRTPKKPLLILLGFECGDVVSPGVRKIQAMWYRRVKTSDDAAVKQFSTEGPESQHQIDRITIEMMVRTAAPHPACQGFLLEQQRSSFADSPLWPL